MRDPVRHPLPGRDQHHDGRTLQIAHTLKAYKDCAGPRTTHILWIVPLRVGRALRHRNYRLFFAGQGTSLIGTWITRVATSWLVYRLSGSALVLGIVGFAGQIPTFLAAPFAGVWVDRWNRHRTLVVTQALAMIQSALLAAFALSGRITVAWVLVLQVFQGLINAVDTPARQSFVVEMVEDRADLPNAIALNSSMVNAARLVGPSIAGVLIAAVGEGWCFALDAASYLAVIASLVAMRLPPRPAARRAGRLLADLREGFGYAAGSPPIRAVLLLLATVSLTGVPYTVLMPVFATRVLGGGPHTLGFLMAAIGVGALGGALYLASRSTVQGLGTVLAFAAITFGAGLIAFSRSHALALSLALLLVCGMAMMTNMAAANTILQSIVEDDKRGRIMSFYTMAFFGMVPLGSLLGGLAADRFGAPDTIAAGGVLSALAGLSFLRALPGIRRARATARSGSSSPSSSRS
jgi:MFS family permease